VLLGQKKLYDYSMIKVSKGYIYIFQSKIGKLIELVISTKAAKYITLWNVERDLVVQTEWNKDFWLTVVVLYDNIFGSQ